MADDADEYELVISDADDGGVAVWVCLHQAHDAIAAREWVERNFRVVRSSGLYRAIVRPRDP